MDREKIEQQFNAEFGEPMNELTKFNHKLIIDFLLSKIAEAEKHMAEIAIEQINAIEGDLMEEEHESLSNLCKYAREEIKEAAIKKTEGL